MTRRGRAHAVRARGPALPAVVLVLALAIGCSRSQDGGLAAPAPATAAPRATAAAPEVAGTSAATPSAPGVRIDGRFDDWPEGTFVAADREHLYVRLVFPEERTLQAGEESVVVSVAAGRVGGERRGPGGAGDVGAAATGEGEAGEGGGSREGLRGAGIRVVFSPPGAGGGPPGQGVAASVRAPGAVAESPVGHAALDLVVAPTFAAREFELRIARGERASAAVRAALAAGKVRVGTAVLGADGTPLWRAPEHALELPPLAGATADEEALAGRAPGTIAERPSGTLRVVSWNVLVAAPRKDPEPFARVLRALDPDVLLLQEWQGATPGELEAWLDGHVPGEEPWRAVTSAGWGVAIAARGALSRLGPDEAPRPALAPADPRRGDLALRLVAARAATAPGPLCAASLHLKCCGSAASAADLARRAEAARINQILRDAFAAQPGCLRVVGGDLNLVGSSAPLELLAAGIDADGSALEVAVTRVPGDVALYTWYQPWSRFSPGRLDYLLYAGSAARAVDSFALDTRRLGADALAAAGLGREDSAASDHLPIVVDLVASGGGAAD